MSGTAAIQIGSGKALLVHGFWKRGIDRNELIKNVLGLCKLGSEEYSILRARLNQLCEMHLQLGRIPTDQVYEVNIILEKIQSEFPVLYDKDHIENYEERLYVTRRLIYILHGNQRANHKSKVHRNERTRKRGMREYTFNARLTSTRTGYLQVSVEVPQLSSKARSRYVMLGIQDTVQSASKPSATRRVRFYSPRLDKTEDRIDHSDSLLSSHDSRLSRLPHLLQVSKSVNESTGTASLTSTTRSLKSMSNDVLTEPPNWKETPKILKTAGISTELLSEDVLRFLVSCQPRLAQFSKDFAAFGCTRQEHLLGLAAWGKEMRRKVMTEMLKDATDMEIEVMDYYLDLWSGGSSK